MLLANPSVAHVYCLNRKSKSESVASQIEKNKIYNLDPTSLDPRCVSFLKTSLSDEHLGLQPDTFQKLQETATLVIHNAWPVNFNLSLASSKLQFEGLVNLIKFCSAALVPPRLFFISSISSIMAHQAASNKKIPEEVITIEKPAPNGYAKSKYLAEQLLNYAVWTWRLPVPTSFAQVSQIAGAVHSPGLWNKTKWFPSLVISSLHIGAVPDSLGLTVGQINWVPIDLLAEVLADLALETETATAEASQVQVFHDLFRE